MRPLRTGGLVAIVALVALLATPSLVLADAPVATDDSYPAVEDTTLTVVAADGVLANDTDIDLDAMVAVLDTGPSDGGLALDADGGFTYTPDADFSGTDSFTYHVEAGGEFSGTATASITVNPVNDAPTAVGESYSTGKGVQRTVSAPGILANDSDVDGDTLTAVLVATVGHGTLNLNANGGFTYTPASNYTGPDSFTYKANDGSANSNTATVSLSVQNQSPTAVADAYTVSEDAVLNRNVAASALLSNDTDPEGDSLTATGLVQPAHGVVSNFGANGTFKYTPAANFNGTDSFTYRAFDGTTQSAPATVTITVSAVNDAPVAVADAYSTPEDTALTIPAPGVLANDSDADGQALTASTVANPTHGTLSLSGGGGFTYTPTPNYQGPDSFTYRASDGTTNSGTVTVTLTITGSNDAPVAVDDNGTTNEDTALTVAAPGVLGNDSDPDGQALTASVVAPPSHGSLTLSANGAYTYTPASNYNGPDDFTYQASDGAQASTATVTLTVSAVNDAPVAAGDNGSTGEDTPLVVAAPGVLSNDTDVDSASLTAVVATGPSHGTLSLSANGGYTYTPAANYAGSDAFTYRAGDGSTLSNVATVSLAVTPVPDPPTAVNDSRSTNEDTVLNGASVLGNDSDPDAGTVLNAILDAGPAKGTLVLNANGTFVYTPLANDSGSVSFTYHATDGALSSNVATVTITIAAVNDAPAAGPDSGSTPEDTQLSTAAPGLKANDTDVETPTTSLTASIVTQPAHGSATVSSNGAWTYQPATDYNGADSFTYRVSDGVAFSAPATVSLIVTAVNDAPVASSDAYQVSEDIPLVIAAAGVLGDDTDVDSASLTASVASLPSHGTLVIQPSGAFTYTPAADYNGTDAFSYRASDGLLQSSIVQVSLTVLALNDPPTFTLGPAPTVAEDSGLKTVSGFLTGIDPGPADEGGQTATLLNPLVVATPLLFAQQPAIDGSGTLTFRPAANRSGSSQVTVNVRDNGGTANGGDDTGSQTFLITVAGTNDPPTANSDSYGTDPGDDGPRIQAGVSTPLDVLANDFTLPDLGETMSIVAVTKAGHGTVTIAPDKSFVTYRSVKGYAGSDSFGYTLSDGVFTDTATVHLTIADTLPPSLGTLAPRFVTGTQLTTKVVVRLDWSANDPGSGVKSYDVRKSTNGGASWTTIYSGTTATSAARAHTIGTHYTYEFRARDKGNRLSAWSAPVTFTATRQQETTSLATYSARWASATISTASGDHTKYAKARNETSTLTFTGRAVSLVSPRSAKRGKAEIRVDGVLVATVNLYRSKTDERRHVWSRSWGSVGTHTVAIRVLGTSGHPRFDVDAWTILQ